MTNRRTTKRDVCLFPRCFKYQRSRGLCTNHYQQARRALKAGDATQADLIERGLMAPKRRSYDVFVRGSEATGKGVE